MLDAHWLIVIDLEQLLEPTHMTSQRADSATNGGNECVHGINAEIDEIIVDPDAEIQAGTLLIGTGDAEGTVVAADLGLLGLLILEVEDAGIGGGDVLCDTCDLIAGHLGNGEVDVVHNDSPLI